MSETPSYDSKVFKEFEHAGWERSAASYHDLFGRLTAQANEAILDGVDARPGIRFLDAPCGTGELADAAAKRGARVTGLDFSAMMLVDARDRYPDFEFRQGDAENLPFENSAFDAVSCQFGLRHFPHPDQAIAEAFRVLAPGGRYAYTDWCPPEKSTFFHIIVDAAKTHGDGSVPLPEGPPVFHLSDPGEGRRMLAAAGFEETEAVELPVELRCDDPRHVLDIIYKSIVRTRALLETQPPEAREKIEQAILEGAERYRKDGEIVLTLPSLMVSGRKP
jgi:ubiquinone/menaquinone biosynthesis C-methylase UbiE